MQGDFNFDQAITKVRIFLAENGYATEIAWVRPADVIIAPRTKLVYIKLPIPESNLSHARQEFELGMVRKLGMLFGTVCQINGVTYCHSWTPTNESEREEAALGTGLKLWATSDLSKVQGKTVRHKLVWGYLKIRHCFDQALKSTIIR